MAEYLIQDTSLTAIADAIREKTGSTDTIAVSDFPTAIAEIPTGGTIVIKDITVDENQSIVVTDLPTINRFTIYVPDFTNAGSGMSSGTGYFSSSRSDGGLNIVYWSALSDGTTVHSVAKYINGTLTISNANADSGKAFKFVAWYEEVSA